MIDTFGRSITYLRVSVTELCNLRCRYCMPEDGVCKKEHADMLTEDELIQAVEAAAALGITKLRVTGGEPLVKKNIVSICRRASRVPGIREVCLTTNGILLPELARPLKEAGVSRLNLSLDIISSYLLAFSRSIAEVGAVSMVGGAIAWKTNVMTTAIMQYTNQGNFSLGIALGMILLAVSLLVNVVISLLQRRLSQ